MITRQRRLSEAVALLGILSVGALLAAPAQAGNELTLRLNDVEARPGGEVALVLRTYATRPVRQGQICLIACLNQTHQGGGLPFDSLDDAVVFSEFGDALTLVSLESDGSTQTAILEFNSATGRVNWSDGPMAAVFLTLSADAPPGARIDLVLDPANTFLLDDAGQPVPLDLRDGRLTVLPAAAPLSLAAEGDEIHPGEVALLGIETSEAQALASAELAFRYDPAITVGMPQVTFDDRHGQATLELDSSTPGLILASLHSADGSLNEVPGQLLSIGLTTSPDVPPGTRSRVDLDPARTHLLGPGGQPVPLALAEGFVTFGGAAPLFSDGFESGSLSAWSGHSP